MALIIDIRSPEFKKVEEKALKKVQIRDKNIQKELDTFVRENFKKD